MYSVCMYVYSEAVVAQVLDELGLQLTDQLSGRRQPFLRFLVVSTAVVDVNIALTL